MKEALVKKAKEVLVTESDGELLFLVYSGSYLHGTVIEGKSDIDIKGVFLPSVRELKLQKFVKTVDFKERGEDSVFATCDDVEIELFSIHHFLSLIARGEINQIEMLFAIDQEDMCLYKTKYVEALLENREKLLSNKVKAFVGFALKQASQYKAKGERLIEADKLLFELKGLTKEMSKKEKNKKRAIQFLSDLQNIVKDFSYIEIVEKKEGIYLVVFGRHYFLKSIVIGNLIASIQNTINGFGNRVQDVKKSKGVSYKALSHAVRAIKEGQDILTKKELVFPLPYSDLLLKIKKGEMNVFAVSNLIEVEMEKLEFISAKTDVGERIESEILDTVLLKTLSGVC